jgi:ATP-dependent Lon protease
LLFRFILDALEFYKMSVFKKKIDVVSHATKLTPDVNPTALQEIAKLINSKMLKIQGIIQRILKTLHSYRGLNIISNSDLIVCTSTLIECFEKSVAILSQIESEKDTHTVENINKYIDQLQQIVDKMSIIMCGYGAASIEDIFFISFGSDLDVLISQQETEIWKDKHDLIMKYVKPIGYKTVHWKQSKTKPKNIGVVFGQTPLCSNKIVEDIIQIELANPFECFDIDLTGKTNYVKIYGIRVVVHNEKTQKTLIIQGLVDDIPIECIHNKYIHFRKREIAELMNTAEQQELIHRLLDTMTIKDALIFGNEDYCKKLFAIMSDVNYVKINKLTSTIRRFIDMDIYGQRSMIMNLLIYNQEEDVQYITYLLYDLINSKNANGNAIDSSEQQMIYDSFPWKIKLFFKETMKHTIKFTKDMMSKYDVNRISLEQQIYVMKVPENVREKAMAKLKEIKGKSDDSGAKAKQYLEGLLKIPFGVYREEAIIKKPKQLHSIFTGGLNFIAEKPKAEFIAQNMGGKIKSHYSALEVVKLSEKCEDLIQSTILHRITTNLPFYGAKQINQLWQIFCSEYAGNDGEIVAILGIDKKHAAIIKQEKQRILRMYLDKCSNITLAKMMESLGGGGDIYYQRTLLELQKSKTMAAEFKYDLKNVVDILDESIYGHETAKNQILKIIGQWMNGEQSGYCFGFEGSPGVGKTSLAKRGLANCLKNENGTSRPFSFIALGGSCNGSTLEGHSYTYVNSTWGRIVDILMDSKCMNPIIYIDELDKVSKTEHGKEIIGILMHLIDTTQNAGFQDKYFSGIDIDLSKALFIFSYNDPSQIDSILLDRIHRIKFNNLSLVEKLVICRKYILPEITRKMGLEDCVELSDDVISYIIETYTLESGVRKLKEVIFDLYGEINIDLLRCDNSLETSFPIHITIDSLETKYLDKYDKIVEKKIHAAPKIGIINGLWANSLGRGGIIPIQTATFPTSTFLDLRLTGMQGDVMKESMNVAKSLAWSLLTEYERNACLERFERTKEQGIHIHCPDGSTPKDGPSAGAAITCAIYSLLSGKPIPNNIAMTGEIQLQGKITEIGGLEQKILGGIKAGVDTFFYPSANDREFEKFMQKYRENPSIDGIKFIAVSEIEEVFSQLYV